MKSQRSAFVVGIAAPLYGRAVGFSEPVLQTARSLFSAVNLALEPFLPLPLRNLERTLKPSTVHPETSCFPLSFRRTVLTFAVSAERGFLTEPLVPCLAL